MEQKSELTFENSTIQMDALPKLEQANFHELEQDYLWLRLTFLSIVYVIFAGISITIGITSDLLWWQPLVTVSIFFGLIYLLEIKGFKIKGYSLRENDVSFKSGLLFFSMTSVPFNRVQHTEVNQGPLARLFDLAEVKIYTAGGASSDITVSGLKIEDANRLKDHITKLSSQYA